MTTHDELTARLIADGTMIASIVNVLSLLDAASAMLYSLRGGWCADQEDAIHDAMAYLVNAHHATNYILAHECPACEHDDE